MLILLGASLALPSQMKIVLLGPLSGLSGFLDQPQLPYEKGEPYNGPAGWVAHLHMEIFTLSQWKLWIQVRM